MDDSDPIRYLTDEQTRAACAFIDPVIAVRQALTAQGRGEVEIAAEAYLGWWNADHAWSRTLNMPARLQLPDGVAIGTKIINSSLSNVDRHLPRASGLLLMIEPETARIRTIMASAHISALRTAAVSVLAAQELGVSGPHRALVIGAGVIAEAHVSLLLSSLPGLESVHVHDLVQARAAALVATGQEQARRAGVRLEVAPALPAALAEANLVIAATTVTEPYLRRRDLTPGSLVVNVSLDDLDEDVVQSCDLLIVDSWDLIRADDHRLLGRLHRAGRLDGPADPPRDGVRRVDAELQDLVTGRHLGRTSDDQTVVVNPFGMASNDVVVGWHVQRVAREQNLGTFLPR